MKSRRILLEKLWDNNLLSICRILEGGPTNANTKEKDEKEYNENKEYIEYLKNRKAEFQKKKNPNALLTRMSTISSLPTSENLQTDTRFEKVLDVMY
jgi:hypothetical protein